jgi:hypothetical protein
MPTARLLYGGVRAASSVSSISSPPSRRTTSPAAIGSVANRPRPSMGEVRTSARGVSQDREGWRTIRRSSSSSPGPSSTKPRLRYRAAAAAFVSLTISVTVPGAWSTTASTSASPTPWPRANGATHIEISATPCPCGIPLTMPAGSPSRSASTLYMPSSRARQRCSVSPAPCQSASLAPKTSGASRSAARRSARQAAQSSTPTTRNAIIRPLSDANAGAATGLPRTTRALSVSWSESRCVTRSSLVGK